MKPIRILLVEDNPGDARLFALSLSETQAITYELRHVDRLATALEVITTTDLDVVMLDLTLPDASGLQALRRVHFLKPMLPIIVLTGTHNEALALEAVQMGAQDYLVKGSSDGAVIVRAVRYAIERMQNLGLYAERARLHALFMQAPVGICVLNGPEHVYELANPVYLQLIGGRDIVGKPLLQALPELATQGFAELLDQVLATGVAHVAKGASVQLALDGDAALHQRYFDFVYEPLRDNEGTVEGVMVVATDVTDQLLARQRVDDARMSARMSEEKFQLLVEVIPQVVWSMSPDGNEAYISPRWFEYTGQAKDTSLAELWRGALHPDDYERTFRTWGEAQVSKSVWALEYRLRRADGAYRWHLGRSAPHCSASGEILGWYGTATDIEEQRGAIKSRDDLLATVSHDLRNPLSTIKMGSALMREATENAALQRNIGAIERAAERMDQLIRDLLDIASIETGHLSVHPARVELQPLLAEAIEAFETQANAKMITIDTSAPREPAWLHCDRSRVLQVLANLLGNATKFTPKGGRITVSVSAHAGIATFRVDDTGPGIAAHELPFVFDRFWQAKETAKAGTGLGLAISKGIVESHGGHISVESTLAVGTTFVFTLPLAVP